MNYDNVKLWFAKNEEGNILTIDEVNDGNKNDAYLCPMCSSKLIPKAVKSKQITSHFAHVDVSQCKESMIHWWFKNSFIMKGDTFTVVSDKERRYICKDVLVEQPYVVGDATYKPDVTVLTECGNTIYFEMAFSNSKKVKDYIDIWLELKNIVVEVDIKSLMNRDKIPTFKALFYDGKCFNVKKNDTYYNTIGKYKEEKLKGNVDQGLKERIQKLDWFWDDVMKYKNGEVDIDYIVELMNYFNKEEKEIVFSILRKSSCNDIIKTYKNHIDLHLNRKLTTIHDQICLILEKEIGMECLKYINKNVTTYNKNDIQVCIIIESYYWRDGCKFRSRYKEGSSGIPDYINIEEYNYEELMNIVLNKMRLNLEYIKYDLQISLYENKVNNAINQIISNTKYIDLLSKIKNRNSDYNIVIDKVFEYNHIDPRDLIEEKKDLNKLRLEVKLNYKDNHHSALTFKVFADIDNIITDDVCDLIYKNINNYFYNLDVIENIDIFKDLIEKLKFKYLDCSVDIDGNLVFEDAYRVGIEFNNMYFKCFYITKSGIINNSITKQDNDYLFRTNNVNEIKKYIETSIDTKLKEELTLRCLECEDSFSLEIGEFKFYNKNNLKLPKRCRCCRDKRKKTGGMNIEQQSK